MSKQIAKLLKTEMAADVSALPMLAKLLQAYGRKGDKVLAHITPEEALMLEEEGGSGTINPNTGLPEYFEEDYADVSSPAAIDQAGAQGSEDVSAAANISPRAATTGEMPSYMGRDTSLPATGAAYNLSPADAGVGFRATPQQAYSFAPSLQGTGVPLPTEDIRVPQPEAAPAPQEKGLFDDLTKGMTPQEKRNLLLRSGLGISSGLMAGYQGRKAAQQAEKARKDTEAIGKPYQEQGRQLQAQALRGELTPAGQQQLQAAQAQLAQGAERRGGVGAQQAATQIQAFRQNLLDQQYNYGLKVAQIGDSYAANAIKVGLTQDAGVSSSMKAYTAALAAMYGMQPNVQG